MVLKPAHGSRCGSSRLIANLAAESRKEINVQCSGWTCRVQELGFKLPVWLGEKKAHCCGAGISTV